MKVISQGIPGEFSGKVGNLSEGSLKEIPYLHIKWPPFREKGEPVEQLCTHRGLSTAQPGLSGGQSQVVRQQTVRLQRNARCVKEFDPQHRTSSFRDELTTSLLPWKA